MGVYGEEDPRQDAASVKTLRESVLGPRNKKFFGTGEEWIKERVVGGEMGGIVQ